MGTMLIQRKHSPVRKQQPSGFTLVEAALCCLVLAILVGLAVPQLERSLSLFRLEAAADLVATELAAGRMLAVSRNWLYEMDCNTTNNTIQVIDPNNSNNHPRLAQFLNSDTTFNSVPGSGSEIQFYARGHARGGTIVVENGEVDTRSIVVSPSGKIKIQ